MTKFRNVTGSQKRNDENEMSKLGIVSRFEMRSFVNVVKHKLVLCT